MLPHKTWNTKQSTNAVTSRYRYKRKLDMRTFLNDSRHVDTSKFKWEGDIRNFVGNFLTQDGFIFKERKKKF